MKKLIPFVMLMIGFQSVAQIRIESANPKSRVSIELGGNTGYYRDRHYGRYIRPYEYLRLSSHQEARLYDMLYALESRRLDQRAYDDMLYRDLQRLLDRRQFALWNDRYYAPRYQRVQYRPQHDNRYSNGRGKAKGHHKNDNRRDWNNHKGHNGHGPHRR